jgi:predicted  nucleic acid-binding Zn-ribbon protein
MMLLDRRRLLKLAAASLLLAAGCTNTRQDSDLDAAMSELDRLLDEMGENEQRQVTSIVQRIQTRARELAAEHRTFTDNFDSQLSSYHVTEAQLEQLIETYNRRRTLLRNDLLHLQDELHAAMSPDDWAEVMRVLNRAGKSMARYTLTEG